MTREETFHEVRAQVEWNNSPPRIRAALAERYAHPGDLEAALREYMPANDRRRPRRPLRA